jgi:hypothetical protein
MIVARHALFTSGSGVTKFVPRARICSHVSTHAFRFASYEAGVTASAASAGFV